MADLRDVMNALAGIVATTLYPSGTGNPISPVSGASTAIQTGWPVSSILDQALANGTVTVSIYAGQVSKNTTRFLPQWQDVGTVTAGQKTTVRELRRVARDIQITTWAPTPDLRDATGAAIDVALARIDRLALADGSIGQMRFARDSITDGESKETSYRRDLWYTVEYGTFETQKSTLVTSVVADIKGGQTLEGAPIKTITVTQGH